MRVADVFPELEKAIIQNQEINCYRQERNGRVKWVIEIQDPVEAESFQGKMNAFIDRMRGMQEGNPCP